MESLSGVRILEDLRREILSDGAFHVVTLALLLAGSLMLWGALRRGLSVRAPQFLAGAFALAWGLALIVESIVHDHHLRMHHVRPGPNQLAWDLTFLAVAAGTAILGPWMLRSRSGSVLGKDAE